ncbi:MULTISPECIES: hypothetical protein [unclassified Streptomyces]|uniref:hypothetical protein n=1 Tax=unclassified Streptomyces TaxID=2593676 RepID=UPI0038175891
MYTGRQDPYGPSDRFGAFGSEDRYGPEGDNGTQTPDWGALADASAARARRKRWLMFGGGALASGAVAAMVATGVASVGNGDALASGQKPSEQPVTVADLPPRSPAPEPTFSEVAPPPPANPKDYVSSADKDRAPLSAETLFPDTSLSVDGRSYRKGATTATTNCAAAAQGALGSILASNSCDQVIRATFSKNGIAVTIGIAVFGEEAQALKAKKEANSGGIASLSGNGVPTFCRAPSICRKTTNSYGRYVYFTVGGFTNGQNVVTSDKKVFAVGDDVAEFAFRRILARGQAQASAAATVPVEQ